MTADFARQATKIEPLGGQRLRVAFPENRELAKRGCEKPERKSKLEAALCRVSARNMQVELVLTAAAAVETSVAKPSGVVNRRQRQRDAEQNPVIRQLIEMFEAEIVRVDEPQGSGN
jgi:hypothetical protein